MIKVKKQVSTKLETKEGTFEIEVFTSNIDELEYIVLKTPNLKENPLVRLHSKCFTGDIFHSLYCDCYDQLQVAKNKISKSSNGLIIYLDQEGRGIGLINKLKAYNLQREGYDTLEANLHLGFAGDLRRYDVACEVLKTYGFKNITLLSNNVEKINEMSKNFNVIREKIIIEPNEYNEKYLETKKKKMEQLL